MVGVQPQGHVPVLLHCLLLSHVGEVWAGLLVGVNYCVFSLSLRVLWFSCDGMLMSFRLRCFCSISFLAYCLLAGMYCRYIVYFVCVSEREKK